MIFATIGTHNIGFERLVVKMDEIAGRIDEEVVIQIGSTRYTPKHAGYFDFTDEIEYKEISYRTFNRGFEESVESV